MKDKKLHIQVADIISKAVKSGIGVQADISKGAFSRDWQYKVDKLAENTIKNYFSREWKAGLKMGYYTEEQGLVLPEEFDKVMIIDPVDGSRAAQRGMEACTVIAIAPYDGKKVPTLKDVEMAITRVLRKYEKESEAILYSKGKGVRKLSGEKLILRKPDKNPEKWFVDFEVYSFPNDVMGIVYAPIVNAINAPFIFHAASKHLYALAEGLIQGVVDARLKVRKEFPELCKKVEKTVSVLDICSMYPVIKTLGGVIKSCNGKTLDNVPLWGVDENGIWEEKTWIDYIAAPDEQTWKFLKEKLDEGFENLKGEKFRKNIFIHKR